MEDKCQCNTYCTQKIENKLLERGKLENGKSKKYVCKYSDFMKMINNPRPTNFVSTCYIPHTLVHIKTTQTKAHHD